MSAKRDGVRWAVLFLLTVAAAPLLIVLALYVRWWWAGGRGADCDPLPISWQMMAIAQEALAVALTFLQFVGRRAAAEPPAGDSPDLVLLPGSALDEAALAPLIDRLGTTAWTMTLFRPTSWRLPIADAAAQLDAFLRTQANQSGVVLVAHGAAGLILRYYLRRYRATGIRRVVTIGTAHQGTDAPLPDGDAPAASIDTIRQLNAADRVPHQFDVIAIASDFDEFIAPATSAYYPGAFNIQVRGLGHFALARSQRLFDLLAENIGAPA